MASLTDRRFTDAVQLIVKQIAQRASARGLFHLDDTTVVPLALWTLIRWERKVGLDALERMGVDLHRLSDKLDKLLCQLAKEHPVVVKDGVAIYAKTGQRIAFDPTMAIEFLLTQSETEARKLNHSYVASEHLLLAIISLAESRLATILDEELIRHDCTTETILELLG